MTKERLLPVGTRVYSVLESSWGIVKEHKTGLYPLLISFESGNKVYYTKEGKVLAGLKNPNLSLTEYTLEKGGFTPISEYWSKPKIGDWGYFWDNSGNHGVHFGRLIDIDYEEEYPYTSHIGSSWHNFSHEIPDHIKKQMAQ